jgi:hypothetical protein
MLVRITIDVEYENAPENMIAQLRRNVQHAILKEELLTDSDTEADIKKHEVSIEEIKK